MGQSCCVKGDPECLNRTLHSWKEQPGALQAEGWRSVSTVQFVAEAKVPRVVFSLRLGLFSGFAAQE